MPVLLQKLINVFNLVQVLLKDSHSVGGLVANVIKVFKSEGLHGIKLRIRAINRRRITAHNMALEQSQIAVKNVKKLEHAFVAADKKALLIPHYFDPALSTENTQKIDQIKVAVHLHIDTEAGLLSLLSKINRLPAKTDIYVTHSTANTPAKLKAKVVDNLSHPGEIMIAKVPENTGALLPLLVEFIDLLPQYEIVGHFHTLATETAENSWDTLLGTVDDDRSLANIFSLIKQQASSVFQTAEPANLASTALSQHAFSTVQAVVEHHAKISIATTLDNFPVGSMFWARPDMFSRWQEMALSYQQFSRLQAGTGNAISHVLSAALCVLSQRDAAQHYYLPLADTLLDYTQYEEQHDYSATIVHDDIQVLSYYLPQFHPIPENDLWHGKGFTEWTKVRAANPLFKGHYQQQIPHTDLGYYLLDSPDTLRKQAAMMQKAGVQGQVFYHYWFGGKLILEEPSQMLLANPDIDIPFSFCWANENWTMRWDGNDTDVLLAQNYSEEDARAFIQYLIPFFLDKRYITIEGRPALWVYRPSHIENVQQYVDVWAQECAKHDLAPPYVIAILTRGIKDPKNYAMDAAVERVLHDWTDGMVDDIRPSLEKYHEMTGGALDYSQVADFYEAQTEPKDFTYFRSLVPLWDNTARYHEKAILLHGGSPQRFQQWLQSSIDYSKQHLPADKRFVVINAWNEWAEGAHLEPDSCHGYGYLNAIGRALSNVKFGEEINYDSALVKTKHLHIELLPSAVEQLNSNPSFKRQFAACLQASSLLKQVDFSLSAQGLFNDLGTELPTAGNHLTLSFANIVLFTADALENMYKMWQQCATSAVVPNHYANNVQDELWQPTANGSVDRALAHKAPFILYAQASYKNLRLCAQAQSFGLLEERTRKQPVPAVSTIIRYHQGADIQQLRAALYCLAAMRECQVTPLITAQDLDQTTQTALQAMLDDIVFADGIVPKVIHFSSDGQGDLRAKTLNEGLQQVSTRYATFLDYDDLLLADAYSWLLDRLSVTGKAVAFARVFKTDYQAENQLLLARHKHFEFGGCYEDFIYNNHAPLHSFMLDLSQLDVHNLTYHDQHKYMEDYFLTLQLFTADNCDWESLSFNKYIGDYIYSVDRQHTLAFNHDSDKTDILKDQHYEECEQRINDVRQPIYKALTSSLD